MNKLLLVGRICSIPIDDIIEDKDFCWFTVAVKRDYKTNGLFETDYINLKVFGKTKQYFLDSFHVGNLVWVQATVKDIKQCHITKDFVVQQIFKLDKSKNLTVEVLDYKEDDFNKNKKSVLIDNELSSQMKNQIKKTYS